MKRNISRQINVIILSDQKHKCEKGAKFGTNDVQGCPQELRSKRVPSSITIP